MTESSNGTYMEHVTESSFDSFYQTTGETAQNLEISTTFSEIENATMESDKDKSGYKHPKNLIYATENNMARDIQSHFSVLHINIFLFIFLALLH